ncbi:MAG: hypothetical protein MRJ52_03190 [Nitrosomonas sp.]|nr:hypothetical protein [Nitrosomonas sp.]
MNAKVSAALYRTRIINPFLKPSIDGDAGYANHIHRKINNGQLRMAILLVQILLFNLVSYPPAPAETGDEFKAYHTNSTPGLYDVSTSDIYKDGKNIHIIAGDGYRQTTLLSPFGISNQRDGGYSWTDSVTVKAEADNYYTPAR